jgi:hypothetical protein
LFVLDLFTNVVCVSRVHPLTVVDGIHASYRLYLVLTYSPMLSVSLEFTPSQFLMGSMLLIVCIWSWLIHQCFLCLLSSHLHSCWWIQAAYLLYLVLSCSPMLYVSLEFILGLK